MKKNQAISDTKLNKGAHSRIILANLSKPASLIPLILLFFIVTCAVFAPFIAPTNPYDLKIERDYFWIAHKFNSCLL